MSEMTERERHKLRGEISSLETRLLYAVYCYESDVGASPPWMNCYGEPSNPAMYGESDMWVAINKEDEE